MKRSILTMSFFLTSMLFILGCSSEEKLFNVSGNVNFEGKPVPKGVIHFDPDVTKGAKGTAGFASIVDGKFNTADNGKGVRGGPYSIRINGFDGKVGPELPFGKDIFPEYTETRELKAENQTITIDIKKKK
jgi:hypothetical protein